MTLLDALAVIAAYDARIRAMELDGLERRMIDDARSIIWQHAESIRREREKS